MYHPARVTECDAILDRYLCVSGSKCHRLGFTETHSAIRHGCRKLIQILVNTLLIESGSTLDGRKQLAAHTKSAAKIVAAIAG